MKDHPQRLVWQRLELRAVAVRAGREQRRDAMAKFQSGRLAAGAGRARREAAVPRLRAVESVGNVQPGLAVPASQPCNSLTPLVQRQRLDQPSARHLPERLADVGETALGDLAEPAHPGAGRSSAPEPSSRSPTVSPAASRSAGSRFGASRSSPVGTAAPTIHPARHRRCGAAASPPRPPSVGGEVLRALRDLAVPPRATAQALAGSAMTMPAPQRAPMVPRIPRQAARPSCSSRSP